MPTLSILISVYEEAALLEQVVERVASVRLSENFGRDIIIVDDASKDSTPKVIQQLCKKYHDIIT
jgi:glycosyltransferase involved in cell wall biosynthesis